MKTEEIVKEILSEIDSSIEKHGDLPQDMFQQITIVNEEVGEANKAVLHFHYEGGNLRDVRKELIQSAAMCIKMISQLGEGYSLTNG
jgi:NTP pyrophosphatase (non-canonical NTP hydrolase)